MTLIIHVYRDGEEVCENTFVGAPPVAKRKAKDYVKRMRERGLGVRVEDAAEGD